MSDWVKTQNGWSQTSGNGVGRDEFNEVKSSLNQLFDAKVTRDGLTFNNCTYFLGGYTKIGKLVIVNIRVTATNTSRITISGFPLPASSGSNNFVSTNVNPSNCAGAITFQGVLNNDGHSANQSVLMSAVYICE